jgi:hypothetical protein
MITSDNGCASVEIREIKEFREFKEAVGLYFINFSLNSLHSLSSLNNFQLSILLPQRGSGMGLTALRLSIPDAAAGKLHNKLVQYAQPKRGDIF